MNREIKPWRPEGCWQVLVVTLLAILGLTGCIPHARVYHQVDAPDASHDGETCGMGARAVSRFPFDGFEVAINLNPGGQYPWLWLLADPTDEFVLDGEEMFIKVRTGEETQRLPMHPYRTEVLENGRLQGEYFSNLQRQVYRFRANEHLRLGASGSILIPAITFNGKTMVPTSFPYSRRRHFGLLPLNC